MKRAAIALCLVVMVGSGTALAQASGPDAGEIIERMEATMRGASSQAEMTMIIERPRYTREVSLKLWSLGNDYSLTLITAPARDQGTVFLKRENEVWNYVPNIDRTIKMPPSMMSQSWMGSDFTTDDLVRESSMVDDYAHQVVREEEYEGRDAWVLELIPHPDTPVVWGRVLVWVDQTEYMQLRIEQYDQNDALANTLAFSEVRALENRSLPTRMVMSPADKPDQRTIMIYDEIEFDIDISPSFFTQQNMTRVR